MLHTRSEWKFICTDSQLELIHSRLSSVLSHDSHANKDGIYHVHSLYFDDYRNSCAAGNESGDGLRYKYRVRYYNDHADCLYLEKKEKRFGLGCKRKCNLSAEEYQALLSGHVSSMICRTDKQLLKEFGSQVVTRLFTPKAIIDYDRIAFSEPLSHIRITLDQNITVGNDCTAFTSGKYSRFPVQAFHENILEVKFDDYFPGWLRKMLDSMNLQQTTFSKYYLGRKKLENLI